MKVMVQPGDGIALLLSGIKSAKKSIEMAIFRLDQSELEAALEAASRAAWQCRRSLLTPTEQARKACGS